MWADLLTTAHEIIGRRTGSTALGYRRGADLGNSQRSDATAEAIYDAMAALGINYINPPASWDEAGLEDPHAAAGHRGQGTCLDTAVVMAAAFSKPGFFRRVVLVQGHAFAAYFRGGVRGTRH